MPSIPINLDGSGHGLVTLTPATTFNSRASITLSFEISASTSINLGRPGAWDAVLEQLKQSIWSEQLLVTLGQSESVAASTGFGSAPVSVNDGHTAELGLGGSIAAPNSPDGPPLSYMSDGSEVSGSRDSAEERVVMDTAALHAAYEGVIFEDDVVASLPAVEDIPTMVDLPDIVDIPAVEDLPAVNKSTSENNVSDDNAVGSTLAPEVLTTNGASEQNLDHDCEAYAVMSNPDDRDDASVSLTELYHGTIMSRSVSSTNIADVAQNENTASLADDEDSQTSRGSVHVEAASHLDGVFDRQIPEEPSKFYTYAASQDNTLHPWLEFLFRPNGVEEVSNGINNTFTYSAAQDNTARPWLDFLLRPNSNVEIPPAASCTASTSSGPTTTTSSPLPSPSAPATTIFTFGSDGPYDFTYHSDEEKDLYGSGSEACASTPVLPKHTSTSNKFTFSKTPSVASTSSESVVQQAHNALFGGGNTAFNFSVSHGSDESTVSDDTVSKASDTPPMASTPASGKCEKHKKDGQTAVLKAVTSKDKKKARKEEKLGRKEENKKQLAASAAKKAERAKVQQLLLQG
ncbi:hypothetical protein K490DRAFT_56473 [Saccharata proteae CBS 121410]|uniref:Uncharacterized protein n=1 Tax=Saccharata proteae CBS 121410 TaxID=1314787 RepID=A0A9P4HWT1_9PEZI|nr:hypothetical protein K490DRAFT_56473 [Saccharata proteae CBS 121410]